MLRRFCPLTPALRPLLDEIQDPPDPPAIVLKHYDSDLLAASNAQRLTRREIRQVARNVLEALDVLHSEGYVHTGNGLTRSRYSLLPFPLRVTFSLTSLRIMVLTASRILFFFLSYADVKPSNILVDFGVGADNRFADVVLADCGSTVHVESRLAQEGELIGAPIFRSPEAHLQLRWGTSTDIWSFGTTVRSTRSFPPPSTGSFSLCQ